MKHLIVPPAIGLVAMFGALLVYDGARNFSASETLSAVCALSYLIGATATTMAGYIKAK